MGQAMLTVRMDPVVKERFAKVCEGLGMSASTAVNLLARQMIADGALPFAPSLRPSNNGVARPSTLSREEIAGAVGEAAGCHPEISRVTLFGSYARGEATASSDVDLRIEYDSSSGFSALDLSSFVDEVSTALGRRVDVVSKRSLDDSLAAEIARDGVSVYERPAA